MRDQSGGSPLSLTFLPRRSSTPTLNSSTRLVVRRRVVPFPSKEAGQQPDTPRATRRLMAGGGASPRLVHPGGTEGVGVPGMT